MHWKMSRRSLLARVSAGIASLGFARIFSLEGVIQTAEASGELFEGFVILPNENATPPSNVRYPIPDGDAPVTEQLPGGEANRGHFERFANATQLAGTVEIPTFVLASIPPDLREGAAIAARSRTGKLYETTVSYEPTDQRVGPSVPRRRRIGLVARAIYPTPFPIWTITGPGPHESIPIKVDFLPSPGIETPTRRGFVFHWIQAQILFQMSIDNEPDRLAAEELASSLIVLR